MSTDKGFINVYRDICDHWVWKDKPFTRGQAWIDLIMMANHIDKKVVFDGKPEVVKRGSCITSMRKLAEKWGWSTAKVRRFLDALERDGSVSTNRNTKRTAITIEKYSIYQGSRNTKRNTDETPTKRRRYTDENKQYTKERMKKKEKKEPISQEELDAGGWGYE